MVSSVGSVASMRAMIAPQAPQKSPKVDLDTIPEQKAKLPPVGGAKGKGLVIDIQA